jgi:opacity protein-like surface antigen
MKRSLLIFSFSIFVIFFSFSDVFAQFYVGPYIGFVTSGLKGAGQVSENGQVSNTNTIADGGSNSFTAGVTVGYQVIPPEITAGLYKLDLNIDASWASFNYFENAYNSSNGAGKFSADGLSGGGTTVISIDIMPMHRFHFRNFILSPYAGIGLGIDIMSTADITVGPPSATGTITGNSETKFGLLLFYGTLFNVTENIQPFIQFKHFIPFGSESTFTQSYQLANGGGSENLAYSIQDVPGFFTLSAGVRFSF